MPKNTLYNYIAYFLTNEQHTGSKIKYKCKILKQDDKDYIRLDLPVASFSHNLDKISGKKLAIAENHVTVYNNEDTSNPHTSQYHYTATFSSKGKAKQHFRLHVYFDKQGEITTAPEFKEIIDRDGQLGPVIRLDQTTQQAFIQLAQQSSQSLLAELYEKQSKSVKQLMLDYDKSNERCQVLSLDLSGNFDEYLIYLDQCIATAHTLASLEQQPYYQGKCTFLTSLKIHVIEAKTKQAKLSSQDRKVDDLEVAPQQTILSEVETVTAFREIEVNSTRAEEKAIGELIAAWADLDQKTHDHDYPADLSRFLNALNEQSLIFQDNPNANPLLLNRMFQLITKVETRIKIMLAHYLDNNTLDLANKLSQIQHLITEDQVYDALEKNQPEALNYLLTQGQFNLSEMHIKDVELGYMSLASYCFRLSSETHPLLPCLRVLIEHNANLFEVQADGLPLAYSIYSSNNDELVQALNTHAILNPEFYKRLIATLTFYLATHPDEPTVTIIQSNLQQIQAHVDTFAIDVKRLGVKEAQDYQLTQIAKLNESKRLNQEFFASDNNRRVRSDPEVLAAIAKREEVEAEVLRVRNDYLRITKPLRAKLTQRSLVAEEVSQLQETPNIIYSSYFKGLSFEQLKTFTLLHLGAGQRVLEAEIASGRIAIALETLKREKPPRQKPRQQDIAREIARLTYDLEQSERQREESKSMLKIYESKKYEAQGESVGKEALAAKALSPATNPHALFTPRLSVSSPAAPNTTLSEQQDEAKPLQDEPPTLDLQ